MLSQSSPRIFACQSAELWSESDFGPRRGRRLTALLPLAHVCGFYFSSEPARDTKLTTYAFTRMDFTATSSQLVLEDFFVSPPARVSTVLDDGELAAPHDLASRVADRVGGDEQVARAPPDRLRSLGRQDGHHVVGAFLGRRQVGRVAVLAGDQRHGVSVDLHLTDVLVGLAGAGDGAGGGDGLDHGVLDFLRGGTHTDKAGVGTLGVVADDDHGVGSQVHDLHGILLALPALAGSGLTGSEPAPPSAGIVPVFCKRWPRSAPDSFSSREASWSPQH